MKMPHLQSLVGGAFFVPVNIVWRGVRVQDLLDELQIFCNVLMNCVVERK